MTAVKNTREKLTSTKINSGWSAAVVQAESQILSLGVQIEKLKEAIAVFNRNSKNGEPWIDRGSDSSRYNVTDSATES
jgi:hypothetical protein